MSHCSGSSDFDKRLQRFRLSSQLTASMARESRSRSPVRERSTYSRREEDYRRDSERSRRYEDREDTSRFARREERGDRDSRYRRSRYEVGGKSRNDNEANAKLDRYKDRERDGKRDSEPPYGRGKERERSRERDRDRENDDRPKDRRKYDDDHDDRRAGPSQRRSLDRGREPERHRSVRSGSRSKSPAAASDNKDDEKDKDKGKPNFKHSGLLAAATNMVKHGDGTSTLMKYNEPPEARKPSAGWRLYVFKGSEQTGEHFAIERWLRLGDQELGLVDSGILLRLVLQGAEYAAFVFSWPRICISTER